MKWIEISERNVINVKHIQEEMISKFNSVLTV